MVGIRPRLNKLVGLSLILVGLSTNIRGWVYLAFYGPGVYLASTRSRVPNNLFGLDLGIIFSRSHTLNTRAPTLAVHKGIMVGIRPRLNKVGGAAHADRNTRIS